MARSMHSGLKLMYSKFIHVFFRFPILMGKISVYVSRFLLMNRIFFGKKSRFLQITLLLCRLGKMEQNAGHCFAPSL